MRVSTFVRDLTDSGLRWLKQIGVDDIDLRLQYVPEYAETGSLEAPALGRVVDRFKSFGLRIGIVNLAIEHLWDIYFDRPGAERQIENIRLLLPRLADVGIDLVGIKPNNAQYLPPAHIPGSTQEIGRGGYVRRGIDLNEARETMDAPLGEVAEATIWAGYYRLLEAILPVAETAGMRLAHHGNDPPIPEYRGVPHVLRNFEAFDRLFAAFPSPAHGMTYCVGTRYESGEDVAAGIERYGRANRIFHVHFRNVHGAIATTGRFVETFLDDGDMDMGELISALRATGYDGLVNIDHIPTIDGDSPDWKMGSSWLVGDTKALLAVRDPVAS
jgi:mannonate dehydratase